MAIQKKKSLNFRPNFRRQILYAGMVWIAIFVGYGVATVFFSGNGKKPARVSVMLPKAIPTKQPPRHQSQKKLPDNITPPEDAPQSPASKDKMPPWRRYATTVPRLSGKPMIVVVIDDMGVDRKRSARIIAIKAPLTLSFMTYANDLADQTEVARASGHELLLHISMQPSNPGLDAGPNVLLVGMDKRELRRRLMWDLSRFSTYVGVNNHMGSKFTQDIGAMTMVMKEIKRRGLLFLDSKTTAKTVGPRLARRMNVPYAERDIFLDNVNQETAVKARLAETERLAKRRGVAIAIGHPREATIKALKAWLPGLRGRGFQLVPLTTAMNQKYAYYPRDGRPSSTTP